MTDSDIRPPVNLQLDSIIDLARMLVSWTQRDRSANILYFEHNGKHIFGTLISHHGYYENYGIPLWVYTEEESPPAGHFLQYKTRPEEAIKFVDVIESEPMLVHLPIIKMVKKLDILDI